MLRCSPQKCTMGQYFSQPFPKPGGRNVLTLLCRCARAVTTTIPSQGKPPDRRAGLTARNHLGGFGWSCHVLEVDLCWRRGEGMLWIIFKHQGPVKRQSIDSNDAHWLSKGFHYNYVDARFWNAILWSTWLFIRFRATLAKMHFYLKVHQRTWKKMNCNHPIAIGRFVNIVGGPTFCATKSVGQPTFSKWQKT